MKHWICFLALTLISYASIAQDEREITYQILDVDTNEIVLRTFGGDSLDRALFIIDGPSHDLYRVIALTYESGHASPMLLDVDSGLNVKARHHFPDSSFAFWFAGTVAQDGNSILSGFRRTEERGIDCYLVKVDRNGEVLWDKTFGGPQHEQGYKITKTRDSCYVIAAQTASWGEGNIDGMVFKIDEQGKRKWYKTHGDSLLNRLYSVIEIEDGDLIITGITNENYPGNSDILAYRLDKDGRLIWEKTIGSPHGDIAHSLMKLTDSTFLIVGYTAELSDSLSDPLLIQMDGNGEVLGKFIFKSGEDVKLINGFVDDAGIYVGTGFVRTTLTSDWDILLFTFNLHTHRCTMRKLRIPDRHEDAYHAISLRHGYALIAGQTAISGNGDVVLLKWKYK